MLSNMSIDLSWNKKIVTFSGSEIPFPAHIWLAKTPCHGYGIVVEGAFEALISAINHRFWQANPGLRDACLKALT